MRTTIYMNRLYVEKLIEASNKLNVSKNKLISLLLTKITNESAFKPKLFKTVQYQKSNPSINWITMHVIYKPVDYEKVQDLKRNYKYSASWLLSYAVKNYLHKIVKDMTDPEKHGNIVDNYDNNFIYISRLYGKIKGFTTIWGVPKEKYLTRLL